MAQHCDARITGSENECGEDWADLVAEDPSPAKADASSLSCQENLASWTGLSNASSLNQALRLLGIISVANKKGGAFEG